jgi:enediyne biosynthesis protein E4
MRRLAALLPIGLLLCGGCQPDTPPGAPRAAAASSPASPPPTPASVRVRLREVAAEAGLDYRWTPTDKRPLTILGTIGQGCAFLDYDGDGHLDILLVGSPSALYKGDGKGTFTPSAALPPFSGRFLGCAVGDMDNDGYPDIYLTGYREGRLLQNEKGQRFRDITGASGIPAQRWASSASFTDVDRDGLLDLYIANYAVFDKNTKPQLCDFAGVMSACGPRYYVPERGRLYRNRGSGRFVDITETSGAKDVHGRGLGVAAADFDGAGRDSIAIANDEIPSDLLRNQGGGRFVNEGEMAGTARNNEGSPYGGMGIDWGDYNGDGRLDLAVATFQNEVKILYRNDGDGLFSNRSGEMQMDDKALPYVTFGLKFLDLENDGRLDLILANGHVQDNMEQIDSALTYRQPVILLGNEGSRFADRSPTVLKDLPRIVGRGLAIGDYDNDGRVDVLIVDMEGSPLLLHNETESPGNYLSIRLIGSGKSNRSAHGTRVTATLPDGKTLLRHCQTDGSYLSASDPRVHIGLGKADKVTVRVRWPSGRETVQRNIAANQRLTLREPQ